MKYSTKDEMERLGFKIIKRVFLLFVVALFIFVIVQSARAEDDERDDDEHEDNWDFSDDFSDNTVVTDTSSNDKSVTKDRVYIYQTVPVEVIYLTNNTQNKTNSTIELNPEDYELSPEEKAILNMTVTYVNLTEYEDSDRDGIINRLDLYPGENDNDYIDSDSDGIVDAADKFPGTNDLDFEDSDQDGVIDSQDSNIGKQTDKDHDGIDDAYDTADNRPFFAKIAAIFGLN
jgi:hypothetical protein